MQTPISKRYLNLLKIHFYAMFKVQPGIKVITGRHEPIIIVEMAEADMSIIDTYDIPGFYGCLKVLPYNTTACCYNIRIEVKKTRMDEILAGHIKIKTKVEKQLIDDTEIEATLRSGINTLKERRKKHGNRYGNVYKQFGKALLAHFPNGIHIGPEDYDKATKLGVIVQCLTKSTRYCAAFDEGGHKDSAHDLMNYGAMLESVTKK